MEKVGDSTMASSNARGIGDPSDEKITAADMWASQSPSDVESSNSTHPAGVVDMETMTIVWTKQWLIAAYAVMMLISFINTLQQQANFTWTPFVTSSFNQHGLTAVTGIVSNVVGGVSRLPLARFIDLVGRPQGFLLCLVCIVLSLILMAVCQDLQTYAVAQVFYWSGMNGIDYFFTIFIADTSLMENRLVWFAFQGTPYICNTFAGPKIGEAVLGYGVDRTWRWRWGYGAFAIITPVVSMLFWGIFWAMRSKARKLGLVKKQESERLFPETLWHWCLEFDVIGLLLLCGGFSIFLLPFSLEAKQKQGWASPTVVCMIVFGILLLVLFVIWERLWAPKSFFPFYLMKNRSVVAACCLGCNSWIAFYSYKVYYQSYLQVVFHLSVARAGYISNIFNIVSCTWAVAIAYTFKWTDTYKWGAIVAIPIQVLTSGLLIHFRMPGTNVGLLVMVEILAAMAGAMLVQVEQVAVMTAVPHENMATGLALLASITSVGGAIGQTISGAIWTQIVPRKIFEYLPAESKGQATAIYADLMVQIALPWDSAERQAVVEAYGDAQKFMLIIGTCALLPCFVWVAMLKNHRLSEHKARKGLQA